MDAPAVEVVVEAPAAVRPGTAFTVAARVRAPAGWHVYWGENPGETGLATRATLAGAGPPRWSAPTLHRDPGGTLSFVYEPEGRAVWTVTAPARGELPLAVTVDWLACREACVPGTTTAATTVAVRRDAPPPPAEAHLPLPAPASLAADGTLTVCLPGEPEVYPSTAFEALGVQGRWADGRWVARLPVDAPGEAAVVFRTPGEPRGWRVDLAAARGGTCP